ncbi:MAG: NAD-dependent epimerase/dehydratase family protein [Candidatus Aenigmatarchaeota archaeon]
MKVLVTGGCGFLGSHVCEYYKSLGEEVVAFDNLTKHELIRTGYNVELAREYNLNFLKNIGVSFVKGDIRNKEELFRVAKDCDFIVHTAAQPAMTISIEQPELDITTNVLGTFNVLEAARKFDLPIVNSSTIHVYGNKINESLKEAETRFVREPPEIDEDHPILQGKLTPLHASKRSAEIYVQTYIDTYGLKAANFRFTGLYGPRQLGGEDHGWVANFVIRTLLGLPIKIFGTDKQVRDILYAKDAAESFDAFYKKQIVGTYNIGGGISNAISLGECLKLISEETGIKQNIIYEPPRHGDLWYFVCDIRKAKEKLGWKPKTSNIDGIRNLIQWVKCNIYLFSMAEQK